MAIFCRVLLAFAFFSSLPAHAVTRCAAGLRVHDSCELPVSETHPTQFAVGFLEVQKKVAKLKNMDGHDFEKYLRKHPAPVVVGPGGKLYITDGHHLGRALFEMGREDMSGEIIADFSDFTTEEFWTRMKASGWLFLYDENGLGPLDPSLLPETMSGLHDDAYRSLASAVRGAGGYDSTGVYYADNIWANFFRSRIKLDGTNAGFRRAVHEAARLAKTAEAKGLPGYNGDH